ncbi:MFS transporter [Bacillus paralicheniformis]|nr:MFS transporter [Bacillus paralicheniformis]UWS64115.1 MFS transporter [Bacillus paralicheniformis]
MRQRVEIGLFHPFEQPGEGLLFLRFIAKRKRIDKHPRHFLIVNVAIPTIQSQLQANTAQVQFIVAAYVLSYAVFLIPGARLGDRFGRKKMFITGMLVFTAASGLCGMATSAAFLIFALFQSFMYYGLG